MLFDMCLLNLPHLALHDLERTVKCLPNSWTGRPLRLHNVYLHILAPLVALVRKALFEGCYLNSQHGGVLLLAIGDVFEVSHLLVIRLYVVVAQLDFVFQAFHLFDQCRLLVLHLF